MQRRTIFISDTHLGTRGCQAPPLLDFLRHHNAGTIFLVGDIVDGWRLKRGWFWPQAHNDVVQELLAKAQAGTRLVYIPGNHDEMMRCYLGTHFGGIEVRTTAEHVTADGRRFLVTHGDQFDSIVVHAKWLAHVGDRAYEVALWLNTWANRARRLWGRPYWSLSNWAKQQVKQAVNFIGEYEKVLTAEAHRGRLGGVDFRPYLASRTLAEQRAFFEPRVAPLFDTPAIRFLARRRAALFGLGIPPAQFDKLAADGDGDIQPVLRERARKLLCDFPLSDTYFAWQALTRAYAPTEPRSLPPYLDPAAFSALKAHAGRARILNRSFTDLLADLPAGGTEASCCSTRRTGRPMPSSTPSGARSVAPRPPAPGWMRPIATSGGATI
jgi:UDP-2,3-diacylglucosamine pyrophosphatase LpxH